MSDWTPDGEGWKSIGNGRWGTSNRERFIRVWQPGDGLNCRFDGRSARAVCGRPVAAIRLAPAEGQSTRYGPKKNGYVVCLGHLAAEFNDDGFGKEEADAEARALQAIAERHWDEYRSILSEYKAELTKKRIESIPEEFRDRVVALMDSEAQA
jgi:hypothetical protein